MSDVDSFLAGEGLGSKAFYRFARFIINLLCRVFWRVRVTGRENIPLSGAFVLAPVHRSNIDTMLACTVTPRRMRYMGKDSLWKNSVTGWLFSALGGFPVTRGTADREALRRCTSSGPMACPTSTRLPSPLSRKSCRISTKTRCFPPSGLEVSSREGRTIAFR